MMKKCLGKSLNPNLIKPKSTPMSVKTQASVLSVPVFVLALLNFQLPGTIPLLEILLLPIVFCSIAAIPRQTKLSVS